MSNGHVLSGIRAQITYSQVWPINALVDGTPSGNTLNIDTHLLGTDKLISFGNENDALAGGFLYKVGGSRLYHISGSTTQVSTPGTFVDGITLEVDTVSGLSDGDEVIIFAPSMSPNEIDMATWSGGTSGSLTGAVDSADAFVNNISNYLGYIDETDLPEPKFNMEPYHAIGSSSMPLRKGVLKSDISYEADIPIQQLYSLNLVKFAMGGVVSEAGTKSTATTLNGEVMAGQQYIIVDSSTGLTAGEWIQIGDDTSKTTVITTNIIPSMSSRQNGPENRQIIYVSENTIWLNKPLDRPHPDGEAVAQIDSGVVNHYFFPALGCLPIMAIESVWKGLSSSYDMVVDYLGEHVSSFKLSLAKESPVTVTYSLLGMDAVAYEKGSDGDRYYNVFSTDSKYVRASPSEPTTDPFQWREAYVRLKADVGLGSKSTFFWDRFESFELTVEKEGEPYRGMRQVDPRKPLDINLSRVSIKFSLEVAVTDDMYWKIVKNNELDNMIEVTVSRGENDLFTVALYNVVFEQGPYRIPQGAPLLVTLEGTADDCVIKRTTSVTTGSTWSGDIMV